MSVKPFHNETAKNPPDHIACDLEILEFCYCKNPNKFPALIYDFFSKQQNVYLYALDLMFYSKDFFRGRFCSFSQVVIESLNTWSKEHDISHQLTLEIKCLAISRISMQTSGSFVQLVCETFKVKEDYDYFKTEIKNILQENKFKEVCIH